jgi:hypothetical protein
MALHEVLDHHVPATARFHDPELLPGASCAAFVDLLGQRLGESHLNAVIATWNDQSHRS